MTNDTTKRVRLQEIKPIQIYPTCEVTLIRQGREFAEVLYMARKSKPQIRKLNKTEYVDLRTGEIHEFQAREGKHREALRKTFQELRYLIRTNFSSKDPWQKLITLTYAGANMTDKDKLYTDFDKFIKKLKYHCKAHKLEYIVVAEPHKGGGWHMHLMLKATTPGLWIDKDKLTALWGHGATEIQQLKGDDVGSYYVAYFTNLAVEVNQLAKATSNPEEGSKAYIKGGRLQYYPKGFRFYRCSRGIARPTREEIEYWKVQDEYGKAKKSKAYGFLKELEPDAEARGEQLNMLQRESYQR